MEDEMRGLLPRYHDGELGEEAARKVEMHLLACAECRAELRSLRSLSSTLAAAAEVPSAAEAEACWQAVAPRLGPQRAPAPWRSWLPGLLLLGLYGLFGLLVVAGPALRLLTGFDLNLPFAPLPAVLLPLVALEGLPLPTVALSNVLMLCLFGSAGALYLVWLGFWWSRHQAENPAHA